MWLSEKLYGYGWTNDYLQVLGFVRKNEMYTLGFDSKPHTWPQNKFKTTMANLNHIGRQYAKRAVVLVLVIVMMIMMEIIITITMIIITIISIIKHLHALYKILFIKQK